MEVEVFIRWGNFMGIIVLSFLLESYSDIGCSDCGKGPEAFILYLVISAVLDVSCGEERARTRVLPL
jgi:hypothetical protein